MTSLVWIFVKTILLFGASAGAANQPNLLIILADDMGYGDFGCMSSELLQTPNLDALAASGVLCTQASYWTGQSAKHYDDWAARPEPR